MDKLVYGENRFSTNMSRDTCLAPKISFRTYN